MTVDYKVGASNVWMLPQVMPKTAKSGALLRGKQIVLTGALLGILHFP